MSRVGPNEVVPGLVIHLQPDRMKELGGCRVNCPPRTEVRDDHYFLVVAVDTDRQEFLAAPLYSEKGGIRDRVQLDERSKSGKADQWLGRDSFFYKWQFWYIPLASVTDASSRDNSEPENRRFYAREDPAKLADVTSHLSRSRDPWRDPDSN